MNLFNLPLSITSKLKDFGIGVAKGVGEVATWPGHLADLTNAKITAPTGTLQKSQQWQQMTTPTNKAQAFGHSIGSLSPGTELVTPGLKKIGMPGGLAMGIGLGVDVLVPGVGTGEAKATAKVLGGVENKLAQEANLIKEIKSGKYKSAEEFVKAQDLQFHGTSPDFQLREIKKPGELIFTNDKPYASGISAGKGSNIIEAKIDFKSPFVYDAENGKMATGLIREIINKNDLDPAKNIFTKYDGLIIKNVGKEGQTWSVPFKSKSVLTKSQLTDIWNKANQVTKGVPLAQEANLIRQAKGLSAQDIMSKHPDINLKREVRITDIHGNKDVIPAGEALTPYELKGNKVLLQDGETYIVSKNQYQNIKGNAIKAEAKEFAPELKGTEETVLSGTRMEDYGATNSRGVKSLTAVHNTKHSQYQLPGGPLSRDTEILTQKGWKLIDEVKIGDVALTRVDKDGLLEWNKVEAIPQVFAPILYHFKSQSIDMQVTPEHKMVVKRVRRSRQGIFRVTAEKLWKMAECVAPLTGINNNIKATKLFELNAEDIAEFFGWYIAEGTSKIDNGKKNTIVIAQSIEANPEKCERLEALFDRLGFSWKYYGNAYGIKVREMSKALREEIYKQPKSDAKFIPTFFFTQPKNVIEKLLEGLVLGDGTTTKSVSRKDATYYFTKSKQLAGDVQALAVLVNKKATITQRKTGLYVVHFGYKQWASIDGAKHEIVDYNDYAYCVTVKNHAIYVRRNGVAGFTGNSNYKEVLIKAPVEVSQKLPEGYRVIPRSEAPANHGGGAGKSGYVVMGKSRGTTGGEGSFGSGATKAEAIKNAGLYLKEESGATFKSSHWDEPNVISHLRLNERTYQGKKVTFMEELQSDWAREARAKGFNGEAMKNATLLGEKDLGQGIKEYSFSAPNSTMVDTIQTTSESMARKILYDKAGTAFHPFLKNWQELSIKRALKEAVNNNSEYFAWTTGEQQAARYNLAKQVEKVDWETGVSGNKNISITPKDNPTNVIDFDVDKNGTIVKIFQHTDRNWKGKNISEVIGKGVGEKIMSGGEKGNLSGEGLNIGGEWAKNLYDKQVKNIVEDLTGHKVEVIDMGLPRDSKEPIFIMNSGRDVGGKLSPSDLKVGLEVNQKGSGDYIITDILGDGKFKAVPKDTLVDTLEDAGYAVQELSGKEIIEQAPNLYESLKESFDISTKKSTGQQAIKITPEIRARVLGEAQKLKAPSGVLPFANSPTKGAFGAKGQKAIDILLKNKSGEIPAAFNHPKLGDIDLVWGDKGYGLRHILEKNKPNIISKIDDIISNGKIVRQDDFSAYIEKKGDTAVVRLDWKGTPKKWVLTAYEP